MTPEVSSFIIALAYPSKKSPHCSIKVHSACLIRLTDKKQSLKTKVWASRSFEMTAESTNEMHMLISYSFQIFFETIGNPIIKQKD